MLLRMKKSWMKMQPKGRMPPMTMPGTGLVKKDCWGICRGIWFVLTGGSMPCESRKIKTHPRLSQRAKEKAYTDGKSNSSWWWHKETFCNTLSQISKQGNCGVQFFLFIKITARIWRSSSNNVFKPAKWTFLKASNNNLNSYRKTSIYRDILTGFLKPK